MVPDTTDRPVTEFVGRDVYTTNGTHVGTATGVAVDLEDSLATSLTLADLNPDLFGSYPRDARGVHVPFRWVVAVDDIVVVAAAVERFSPPGATDSDVGNDTAGTADAAGAVGATDAADGTVETTDTDGADTEERRPIE
jgi:sporulation protein YlmC with PRC-barrel domain